MVDVIMKYLVEINISSRTLYPNRLSFRLEEMIQSCIDKQLFLGSSKYQNQFCKEVLKKLL